jgi:competence protein ComEC
VEALAMSALVTVTTIPLVAFYFNQVPWLGLLTNLAAVPVMGGVLVPMGLFAALGAAEEGLPFTAAVQWSIDSFVSLLHGASRLPGSEWHLASPSLASVFAFYGCLAGIWLTYERRRWTSWTAATGLLLLFSWWMWSPRLILDGDRFRITFLDVGQGDSAVLELSGGEVILIDGGASYERVEASLLLIFGIGAFGRLTMSLPRIHNSITSGACLTCCVISRCGAFGEPAISVKSRFISVSRRPWRNAG